MTSAQVVIGANYGDCGKGLVTDYLARSKQADVVVRFNGGAQAGHTVTTPKNVRHVFSHFSSGTFADAKTFLSKHFVVNPILFFKEREKLLMLGYDPMVYVDPDALVTTPYDMIINQAVERHRSSTNHGSCGVGFGETIERSNTDLAIYAASLFEDNPATIKVTLDLIRRSWVPERLRMLGVPYTPELKAIVMDDKIFYRYCEDLIRFTLETSMKFPHELIGSSVVFEGAQGLGLDQAQGTFPYVTRSYTGIKNVVEIAKAMKIDNLDVHYVTRAYLTRHGVGPMENELKQKPYKGIYEQTNVKNEFQGKFRFGNLDADKLKHRILTDLYSVPHDVCRIRPLLAVTCLDQLDETGRYIVGGKLKRVKFDHFSASLSKDVGMELGLSSYGSSYISAVEA